MLNLAEGLIHSGCLVDIVAAGSSGPLIDDIPDGAVLIDLGSRSVSGSLVGLIRYIKRVKPAAMLSGMAHCNVVALIARSLARSDMRLVVREASTWVLRAGRPLSIGDRAVKFLMKRFYPGAALVIANSAATAADLAGHGVADEKLIRVIHNPIVSGRIFNMQKEDVRHPWLEDNTIPVVIGMGRLDPIKDFETLIGAFGIIRRKREVRLVILGEGPEKERLLGIAAELGVEKDLYMPGFVTNPHSYLARASVFALSSRWEGFGNVLVEALAAGTPVVSTDCPGGPAEILGSGRYGKLVPIGDAGTMADAIIETLENPPDGDGLIRRSLDFSIEAVTPRYLEALKGDL
jgi:glycosyltransferase involved in cell wall biosynthesis